MKNIVLTGFMGTGKTTVGKLLAEKLNRDFFDTDQMIEKNLEATISEIFKRVGEKQFRQFEEETISMVSSLEGCVISCGGGAVVNEKNVRMLRQNGIIINLYASARHILNRIGEDDNRPIIKKMLRPFDEIKKLLVQRQKAYQNCDLAFSTENLTPEQVAKEILNNKFVKELL